MCVPSTVQGTARHPVSSVGGGLNTYRLGAKLCLLHTACTPPGTGSSAPCPAARPRHPPKGPAKGRLAQGQTFRRAPTPCPWAHSVHFLPGPLWAPHTHTRRPECKAPALPAGAQPESTGFA